MNLRRLSTSSPISVVKIWSVATTSSRRTVQQRPLLRIHGGLRQLLGIHLAETFVALHGGVALAFGFDVLEQIAPVVLHVAIFVAHYGERRLVELRDIAGQRTIAAVLGLMRELDADMAFGVGRVVEHGVERGVLFVGLDPSDDADFLQFLRPVLPDWRVR